MQYSVEAMNKPTPRMMEVQADDWYTMVRELLMAHRIVSNYRFPPSHADIDIQVVDQWLRRNDWIIQKVKQR